MDPCRDWRGLRLACGGWEFEGSWLRFTGCVIRPEDIHRQHLAIMNLDTNVGTRDFHDFHPEAEISLLLNGLARTLTRRSHG